LKDQFLAHTQATLLNGYGPTEATISVLFHRCVRSNKSRSVSIGRPIANVQIFILDRQLQSVPIGVPGELYIGGACLARGYLRHPDVTAERFIPNPFSYTPGARLYKTGDLARYLPDGNIEFLGRIDFQVKIRGFRIELGEIEAVLRQHSGVHETVVLAREESPHDKRLVAYVVAVRGSTPSINELRQFLKQSLPEYMIPSVFVFLDALPLTPNGKVDRRALPAPDQSRPDVEAPFVAPRTPVEETIAAIWREILGVEQVSVYDNFFDLGGHSLLVMQVIAKIEQYIGIRLTPKDFIFQTLGQIALVCKEKMALSEHSEPKSFFRTLWHDLKHVIFQRSQERK
jgi:acyl carrier protein